jgi:hypothetical protein
MKTAETKYQVLRPKTFMTSGVEGDPAKSKLSGWAHGISSSGSKEAVIRMKY